MTGMPSARDADAGRDAGDHLDLDAGVEQRAQLLAAAAEDERDRRLSGARPSGPAFAFEPSGFSMNACEVDLPPPRLPTSMMRAPDLRVREAARFTSSSTSTTSARPSARAALSVMSSGSPGPAPIR